MAVTGKSLEQNLSYKMVIQGGAGTGKTVLAIYFIKCLMDILSRNTNFEDLDEVLPEDSPILQSAQLVKVIQERKNLKVAFVVPTPSFRETVKRIFKATKGLKPSMVIGPNDIAKKDYDIIIVDEAHRLNRRNYLVNNKAYDDACDAIWSGWRLPTVDEFETLCDADYPGVCGNTDGGTNYNGVMMWDFDGNEEIDLYLPLKDYYFDGEGSFPFDKYWTGTRDSGDTYYYFAPEIDWEGDGGNTYYPVSYDYRDVYKEAVDKTNEFLVRLFHNLP